MSQRRQCGLTQATRLLGSLLLVLGVGALWGARPTEAEWLPAVDAPAAGDHVLVAFKAQAPLAARATTVRRFGLSPSGGVQSPYFARLSLSEAQLAAGVSVQTIAAALRQDPAVRVAEPDYYRSADSKFPNDPRFGELWGLHNTGQTAGTVDADVDAPEAWDITTGESPVVLGSLSGVSLAVLDTGVDYTHPDLAANIRRDQAGAIVGYDFVNTDADPMDDNNHGTHMAGTIAASGHNGVGVTGVAWRARLMPVKVLNAAGVGTDSQAIAGIDYARTNGARILCAAWGGRAHSQLLLEAIQRARDADILLVAPAGNNGTDNDQEPYFPAGYQSQTSNMIVVASTDHNDQLAPDSQFGLTSVDLGAPGVNLLSTTRGNTYGVMSGTSVAASYVAGAAALVLARYSSTSVAALKLRLLSSVDRKPGLAGRVRTGGRLNLFGGLENDVTAPGAPTEFRAIERTSSGLCLAWRAAGDDGTNGVAGMYELRYSPAPITSGNFAQAAPAYNLPAPAANGTQQSYALSGLEPGGTYYVALRSLDNVGNASAVVTAGPYVLASVSRLLSDDAEGTALFSGPAPWGITTEQSLSPTRSYADSPGANHANNLNVALTQIGQTALTAVPGALTFQLRTDLQANFDFILAEISADNGATWTEVFRQTGITPWSLYSRSLAAWTGKTIKVRFRLVTDATVTLSGVWLDDIRISVPTAPGSCPLQDTVEGTPAFTGAGTWAVTTEQSFSPTHSYSDSPGASYANDTNIALTQSGSTNLTSLAAPQLEFLARTRLEAGFDFLLAEVSYDNAVSWLPVVKLTGDREWTLITAPLAPGATTRLRFRLNTNSSTVSDGVWIDDIRICGEPCVAIPPSLAASPTSVTAGANITVQYQAPNAASTLDWIGLYKVGDPDSAYKWYAYTQGAFSGSFTTPAPSAAGNYEFRYFTNGVAGPRAFSNAVAVVAASYSVTGSPSSAAEGSGLTCNWSAPSGHSGTDWVGLFRVGEPDSAYLQWSYLGSAASGSFTNFTAPSPPGNYEFRIIGAGGAGRVAVSNPITVTAGASAYTITPGATSIAAGAALSVAWTAPAGHSPFEWLALYKVGDPNSAYGWWSYLGGDTSGSFNLTAPPTTGSYEFRIIRVNGTTAETSVAITVTAAYTITPGAATVVAGAALSVSWTAPVGHGPFEWIGLFRVGDPNSAYGWWSYLGTPTSATFNLTAPETTGDYEFRIIRGNGTEGARSAKVTVTAPTGGSYTITPGAATVVAGAVLGVAWTAPAGHSTADWLALVRVGDPNSAYRWYAYLPAGTSGSFSLTAPLISGIYEFRIIRNTGVTAVTSTVVTVTPAYTITPGSATVPVGGMVSVSWTAPAGHSTGDWIGFFRVGDPSSAYFWFGYLPATTSGSFIFSAPQTPGDYEFRIFVANAEVARSTKVTVTPVTGAYTATPSVTTVAAGAALSVAWTAPTGHPGTDAIGLYPVGQAGSVWSMSLGTGTSGSFNLTAPTTPGNYEFRIVLGNNGTTAATSVTISVTGVYTITPGQTMVAPGGALTVSWTAPAGHPAADYIALFRVGDPNSQPVVPSVRYLGSAASGSFTDITAPATSGDYEYRIIREGTQTDVARSTKITVQ